MLTSPNPLEPVLEYVYASQTKNRFTSGRPDAVLVALISAKTRKQQSSNEGGWVLRSGSLRGQLREARSTSRAPPAATNRSTFSRQHWLNNLNIIQRDIHLIEIKYCEDTRPQNQLSDAQEPHKGLCSILQRASVTLHTSGWGWHHLQHSHAEACVFIFQQPPIPISTASFGMCYTLHCCFNTRNVSLYFNTVTPRGTWSLPSCKEERNEQEDINPVLS